MEADEHEARILYESLHNNYSEFFRNPLTFVYLEQVIIPRLFESKKKRNEKEIRVWSAACAAGQEPYSLAILFDEYTKKRGTQIRYRIFASDICPHEISLAEKGIYPSASLDKVTFQRVQDYFTQDGNNFVIDPQMRRNIDFSVFDLLSEEKVCPPSSIFGNFDLIFCSNVLFYYKQEKRKQILEKFSSCRSSDAFLVTGEAERDILRSGKCREIFVNSGIFQFND
ncbi:MAG: CheR family methyltransferase [Prolixibacteraceae bacterium]|nr:CheR family methyltransferase [Prolixibacteraceae bacterium]